MKFNYKDSLAQLVEHLPFKEVVVGSNPTRVTTILTPSSSGPGPRPFTAVTGVQIPLGSPFFSGRLAQLVERHPYKVDVRSSSLLATTIWSFKVLLDIIITLKF